ncbi:MAG: hypothetical protein WBY44_34380 [Bryobacteraceae bacterium]
MSATLIQNALPGEDLIGIEPELLQQVNAGWLHRLSLFTGRALTAPALQSEQSYRAGRLAILGQCVTQGVVKGLELSIDLTAADPMIQVTSGYGISASGEDVTLLRTLRTTLGSLQVIDPLNGSVIAAFADYAKNPANTAFAGILLLQPVTGQVSGASVDTGTGPIVVSGNLNASCGQDPQEYAFEDWQIVDGVRLVLVAWPGSPATLALPAATPAVSRRNRLAYTIFKAELALTQDDRLPWDMLGVPVALVGFDNTWKAQFIDRTAVVRSGGLPRTRYVLPAQPGAAGAPLLVQPALAEARVAQLAEQIGATPGMTSLVPTFFLLPPCGVLPASSMDFVKQVALWFPSTWTVEVGPVHQEEVETTLLSGMTAQPLDASRPELVEVLVPLPDALYDPDVLVTETVDPAFQQAIDSALQELAADLQHRKTIQQEANALSQVITGTQAGPQKEPQAGLQLPPLYNIDEGLTATEIAIRDAQTYAPAAGETFGTILAAQPKDPSGNPIPPNAQSPNGSFVSTDFQNLQAAANQPPYTLMQDGNGIPLATPLPLFSSDDMNDMTWHGIQHFIDRINGKLAKANDLLDLAFLTTQSDIYRFRQYILGASDATALAVSPIAAEIATGESAASTAANLQTYLKSVLQVDSPSTPPTTTPAPGAAPAIPPSSTGLVSKNAFVVSNKILTAARPVTLISSASPTAIRSTAPALSSVLRASPTLLSSVATTKPVVSAAPVVSASSAVSAFSAVSPGRFVLATPGSVSQPASTNDVLAQSPLVGAQLNLRTLTVAQRMANPPSQEGLFYAIGNRAALLQLLADLEITIDDITVLVDTAPTVTPAGAPITTTAPPTTPPPPVPPPVFPMPTMADFRATANSNRRNAVFVAVQSPSVSAPPNLDPDEASLFSAGIHVLEQHSQLLRAVEARIQQYSDYLTLCANALANVQTDLPKAQSLVTKLDNGLAQARQDLTFTTALLNDETQRVANVNAQRAQTLQNVQVVVYTRPRTLQTDADVPSRQLVPGNITSPVPSCLQQSLSIPPELREIVALLREAPVNWMPSIEALLNRLERPSLLQEVAIDAQARAVMVMQLPPRVSSAASRPGVYAPTISDIYSANQRALSSLVTARAAFQPLQLANQSWTTQIQTMQVVAAIGDLISSQAVHAEVVNATSRLMQQISNVATCLYARAGQALPIDRLAWAEFMKGPGFSIQMQSLAVLPHWNGQDYVSRQQMQMLVDWLFLQIDATNSDAVAFMSDVVRVAILLASDAPANAVISGAVTLAATPKVGGIISLTLPSQQVAHGMYVQIYSSGVLTAEAVVSDLDSSGVRATVTQVHQTGIALQANDVAHFTPQAPVAVALRAFDK